MGINLPLVVANFKANKTWDEISNWIEAVSSKTRDFDGTVVVCPSMAFLSEVSQKIRDKSLRLKVASQNLSRFENGAYTGEVAASQIADQVDFTLIGHSERRTNFGEDDKILQAKVENAQKAGIEPIFCIQAENTFIPQGVKIVAYEPVYAIGTGNPDTPENAQSLGQKLKAKGNYTVLYGGSVTAANVKSFIKTGIIDGVLVGQASLDPQTFTELLAALS